MDRYESSTLMLIALLSRRVSWIPETDPIIGSEKYLTAFPKASLSHSHSASLKQTNSPVACFKPLLSPTVLPCRCDSSNTCPFTMPDLIIFQASSTVESVEPPSTTITSTLLCG